MPKREIEPKKKKRSKIELVIQSFFFDPNEFDITTGATKTEQLPDEEVKDLGDGQAIVTTSDIQITETPIRIERKKPLKRLSESNTPETKKE